MHQARSFPSASFPGASALLLLLVAVACGRGEEEPARLLNASYDPTRELYAEYNPRFAECWLMQTGQRVEVEMSHGGSGKQARAVIDGLEADVVTLALEPDIDALVEHGRLIEPGWAEELPNGSAPYSSTIVFLVRAGNPKRLNTWSDLARAGVELITPNPKTSGGARWIYLAAWGFALREHGGDEAKAQAFVAALYRNVKVLDTGARGSSTTFARNGLGDALITWENEAHLLQRELPDKGFEIVVPPLSILAQPPVAIVDANVDRRGTRALARAYLEGLYGRPAQVLAAENFYRPSDTEVAAEFSDRFPAVELLRIEDVAGSWTKAQARHFGEGGIFDAIYAPGGRP